VGRGIFLTSLQQPLNGQRPSGLDGAKQEARPEDSAQRRRYLKALTEPAPVLMAQSPLADAVIQSIS